MDTKWTFLSGAAAGATLVFLLEPSGTRRRAVVRDKTASAARRGARLSARASRHLYNRSKGLAAEAAARMRNDQPSAEVLAQRVRADLGRAVSDPAAVQVTAGNGRVTLRGPVLAAEVEGLLRRVARVRGVQQVDNELTVHAEPGAVPALQGHRRRIGMSTWSPTARLLSGVAAGTVAVFAFARRVA
jgi:hypothetical protein